MVHLASPPSLPCAHLCFQEHTPMALSLCTAHMHVTYMLSSRLCSSLCTFTPADVPAHLAVRTELRQIWWVSDYLCHFTITGFSQS